MTMPLPRTFVSLFATATFLCASMGLHSSAFAKDFEVWLVDQSNSSGKTFGGSIHTGANVNTVDLNHGGPAGLAPDLADVSPSGNRIFVSLRGPNPLSGDPHASTGSTPGMGVIEVNEHGARGVLKAVVPIHNIDAGGIERADAHGIRVRLK